MLKREGDFYRWGMVSIMSDIAVIAASAKTTLLEIAKQSSQLAIGLQNAAPGERSGMPNNTVQYLSSTAESLVKTAEECGKLLTSSQAPK
jgi:hypothetical protein